MLETDRGCLELGIGRQPRRPINIVFKMSSRTCLHLVGKATATSRGSNAVVATPVRLFQQLGCPFGVVDRVAAKWWLNPSTMQRARTFSSMIHEERGGPWNQEKVVAGKTDALLHDIAVGDMFDDDREAAGKFMLFWSRKKSPEGAEKTEQLLERLVREDEERPKPNHRSLAVTPKLYNIAIAAWGKSGSSSCGEKAEAIWKRMQKRYEAGRHNDLVVAQPDRYTIHSVMDAYAHSPAADAPERVEQLISLLEQLSDDPESSITLCTMSFNILMNSYASRRGEHGSAEKAEDVLLRMSEINKKGDTSIRPDVHSFNTVLKAWLNSGSCLESASRADNILRFMAKLHKDGHNNVRPDHVSLGTCLRAYGHVREGGAEAVGKIEGLLQLLEEVAVDDHHADYTDCYNIALDAVIRSGVDDAGIRAQAVFERMTELESEGLVNVSPDDKTHALILNAKLSSVEMSGNSEETIRRILDNASEGGSGSGIISTASLNKTMDVLWKSASKRGLRSGPKQAEEILSFMERSPTMKPDSSSYNIAITAFLRSDLNRSVEHAFEILKRQERAYNSGNTGALPGGYAYNSVLTGFSRSNSNPTEARHSAKRAYMIIKMMEAQEKNGNAEAAPDIISFNIAIKSLAQAGTRDSANRAMMLLKRLEEGSTSNDVYPDEITYGSVLNALRLGGDWDYVPGEALDIFKRMKEACLNQNRKMRVDTHVYKTLLNILARSRDPRHPEVAYRILQEMMEASERNESKPPDSHCCNLVVKAFANAGYGPNAATRAEEILVDLVKRFKAGRISDAPDTVGFNHILHAWQRTNRQVAVEHAETVMKLMNALQAGGAANAQPDKVTLSLMIVMYATQKTAESAQKAQDLFDSSVDKVEVDRHLYENLMNCWAKSDAWNKVEKVRGIMRLMDERYEQGNWQMRPTSRTYNILLNSCSHLTVDTGDNRERALDTAREAYRELHNCTQRKPDPVTYGTMIQAICNLSDDDDATMAAEVKEVFVECCENGKCGDMVMSELRRGLSKESVADMVGKAGDLPASWQRNVKDVRSKKLSRLLGRERKSPK